MRLNAGNLVADRASRIDIKRRRRIVNVEGPGRFLARITRHRHCKLTFGHVTIQASRIIVQADQDELDLRINLILFVGLLDER